MPDNAQILAGKVALVTGASRGIGAAIATALARRGARVALCARSTASVEPLAKTLGNASLTRAFDVTDSKAVDAAVDSVARECGRLDIVVNNAGLSERDRASRGSDEWWDRALRVNLTGTFYVSRAALRHLGEGGRLVNIASVLGVFGVGDSAAYVAAKHGVIGLTRAIAAETARKGISVNAVCPGWVDTEMAEAGFAALGRAAKITTDEARTRALGAVPTGRILDPAEVAEAVAFLCHPDARGIHGQAIRIDGGVTSW
ncbi:MAG TPA: SDR family NAD(P)-dependent oxidoreductase [bacterium]|nr:SDR family NAD(P)-dependent oxidoreductase [bacterium]